MTMRELVWSGRKHLMQMNRHSNEMGAMLDALKRHSILNRVRRYIISRESSPIFVYVELYITGVDDKVITLTLIKKTKIYAQYVQI